MKIIYFFDGCCLEISTYYLNAVINEYQNFPEDQTEPCLTKLERQELAKGSLEIDIAKEKEGNRLYM